MEEIYKPVLGYLSDNKWREVNNLLEEVFLNIEKIRRRDTVIALQIQFRQFKHFYKF